MYTHGFLIPCLSLYMAWAARERLLREPVEPSYGIGGALIAAGLIMLIVGHAGAVLILQEMSLPVSLAGIVGLLLGRRVLRALWLPIAYLYFMIPFWNILTDPLRPAYQRLSAQLAGLMLDAFGVPVYRNGTILELPNITLEVAPQCSGVHFIIAITAIGIPLAYLYLRNWKKGLALIAAGILIATLFNGLRIGLMGFMSYHGIWSVLHGPGHVMQALSVSLAGYAALFAGLRILTGKKSSGRPVDGPGNDDAPGSAEKTKRGVPVLVGFWAATALYGFIGVYFVAHAASAVPLQRPFDAFPGRIGEWTKTEKASFFAGGEYLEPDHSFSRVYDSREKGQVGFYVGYFERQENGKKLVNHKLAGLQQRAQVRELDLDSLGKLRVNSIVQTQNGERNLMLFWYRVSGRVIADSRQASLMTAMNELLKGRQNGALIAVSQKLPDDDEKRALENCASFIRNVLPEIDRFLP